MFSSLHSRGYRIAESIGRVKALNANDGAEVEMVVRGWRRIRKTDLRPLRTVDLDRPRRTYMHCTSTMPQLTITVGTSDPHTFALSIQCPAEFTHGKIVAHLLSNHIEQMRTAY
jgi:hypothetical protein